MNFINEGTFIVEDASLAENASSTKNGDKAIDVVNDKKLKTPRKAGTKKLQAGTPMAGSKNDPQSLLGRLGATGMKPKSPLDLYDVTLSVHLF